MKSLTVKIIILIVTLVLFSFAGVVSAQGGGTVVAEGLNGPQGVLVGDDGSIWVIDSGIGGEADLPFMDPQTGQEITAKFGESAQIVRIASDGSQEVVANLPSIVTGMDTLGGARLIQLNDTIYATSGQYLGEPEGVPLPNTAAIVKIENGQVSEVASTWAIESAQNPDTFVLDTHPYGLATDPNGNLLVADAAANNLLRVDPVTGNIEVVAVFEGLPGPFPNPNRGGAMETDPVPTGVAVDPSGNIYVSFLSGFPFIPGSAKVVQVSPDGQVSDYATGLTTLTDLRTGPDGNLYAIQFGEFTEQGPTPNSGAIIRVNEGTASEVVASGLSFPTSIDFDADGNAYVTVNGVGAPGSGQVLRFDALTTQPGTPLPAPDTMAPAEADAAEAAPAPEATAAAPAADTTTESPATLPQSGAVTPSTGTIAGIISLFGLVLFIAGLSLHRMRTTKQ